MNVTEIENDYRTSLNPPIGTGAKAKAKGFRHRLPSLRKHFSSLSDKELLQWSVLDPTPGCDYTEWVIKIALRDGVTFSPSAIIQLRVKNALTSAMMFKIDIPRHFDTFQEIDHYQQNGDGWDKLKASDRDKSANPKRAIHGASLVWEGDGSCVLRVDKIDALRMLAKTTEWCVNSKKAAADYLSNGPLYYIATTSDVYLADPSSGQLRNSDDEEVDIDFAPPLGAPLKGAGIYPTQHAERGWSTVIAVDGNAPRMLKHIPHHHAEDILFLSNTEPETIGAVAIKTLKSIAAAIHQEREVRVDIGFSCP